MAHIQVGDRSNLPSKPMERNGNFTTTKVGIVAISLLLVSVGLFLHFKNINLVGAYCCYAAGAFGLISLALWSCLSQTKGSKELSLDLSDIEGRLVITKEDVAQLLNSNPSVKRINISLPSHRDSNWNPDFKALEQHFTWNVGASSGGCYVYDRK